MTIAANIAETALLSFSACFPDSVVGFVADPKKSNVKFVKYALDFAKKSFQRTATGTAQDNLSLEKIDNLKINAPDPKTQSRIASVLSAYDDLIENNEKRIKALEEMAQLLYTEWFIKFNFPHNVGAKNLSPVRMVGSGTEYGMIPEGWEVQRFDAHIKLEYGKALKEEDRIPGKILVCGSGGIVGTHNKKLVSGPGVVIGRKGNAGTVFWVNEDFYPIDTAFFVKTELNLIFIFYLIKSQNFVLGDATVPGLNREQAYRNQILVPPSNLINEFAQKVEPVRKIIGMIGNENNNLSKIRDLLIPQLVTGKRELK